MKLLYGQVILHALAFYEAIGGMVDTLHQI